MAVGNKPNNREQYQEIADISTGRDGRDEWIIVREVKLIDIKLNEWWYLMVILGSLREMASRDLYKSR